MLLLFLQTWSPPISAQTVSTAPADRFSVLDQRLKDLSVVSPGLKEKAEFSVSGVSIQEFLRGLAEAHNLNLNVDPTIAVKVTNNFKNELVRNVLLFLARQYNLDLQFTGAIISISAYSVVALPVVVKPRELSVAYAPATGALFLDLKNDTLESVAKKIMQLSGKNLVIAPPIQAKLVTAFVQELPLASALEKLAFGNNLKLSKTSGDSWIFEPLAENEKLVVRAEQPERPSFFIRRSVAASDGKPSSVSVDIDGAPGNKIHVTADATPLADVIRTAAEEAKISYFIFSDLRGAVTVNSSALTFDEFLTDLFRGTTYTYRKEHGVYLIGERGLEGLRAHRVVQLQNRSIDSVSMYIPAEMKKGVEVKEFKELNSFLLTGSAPQIDEIDAFLKSMDRVVPLITIEVIIVDITKTRGISTGISAGISDSVKTGGTVMPGMNFTFGAASINSFLSTLGMNNIVNIGRVVPGFYVSLKALEQNSNVNVRQTPKLSTLNGHDATLSIGNTRYYANTTQNVLGSLSTQTVVTQQYNPVEANLSIGIKPVVSGDEQVTLSIDVKISDFTDAPPTGPPPTSNSRFKSIIRVKNEEMIVLGGLERIEDNQASSGVPILSRIPILKWLFSSRTKTHTKTVSVIFIKPTIQY